MREEGGKKEAEGDLRTEAQPAENDIRHCPPSSVASHQRAYPRPIGHIRQKNKFRVSLDFSSTSDGTRDGRARRASVRDTAWHQSGTPNWDSTEPFGGMPSLHPGHKVAFNIANATSSLRRPSGREGLGDWAMPLSGGANPAFPSLSAVFTVHGVHPHGFLNPPCLDSINASRLPGTKKRETGGVSPSISLGEWVRVLKRIESKNTTLQYPQVAKNMCKSPVAGRI